MALEAWLVLPLLYSWHIQISASQPTSSHLHVAGHAVSKALWSAWVHMCWEMWHVRGPGWVRGMPDLERVMGGGWARAGQLPQTQEAFRYPASSDKVTSTNCWHQPPVSFRPSGPEAVLLLQPSSQLRAGRQEARLVLPHLPPGHGGRRSFPLALRSSSECRGRAKRQGAQHQHAFRSVAAR